MPYVSGSPNDVATPSPETTTSDSPSPTATAIPSPTPERISELPPLPSGAWSGIHWYVGPSLINCVESDDPDAPDCPSLTVFSWSRGYVAFAETDTAIAVWSSADGLNWTKRHNLNMAGLDHIKIEDLVEGPAGILAVGYTSQQGTCAPPDLTIHALWLSADGISWSPVWGIDGSPTTIAASSRGYIATGGDVEPKVWISSNGRTWTPSALPFAIYRSASVDGPTAFAGGFLIYGEVIEPGGCGGDFLETSTVWFSADGTGWTRELLPGATAGPDVSTSVELINDSTMLADEISTDDQSNTSTETLWTSVDGQTWTPLSAPALKGQNWGLLSNGQRAMVMISGSDSSDSSAPQEPPKWMVLDDNLKLSPLAEKGTIPVPADFDLDYVFGPTGIVATDGSQIWIGVPTAN